ncbi:MAG: PQQ-binding-like beta-propeller repeat protein [Candidatus Bathyarchaeum tardum]|nr:MAG: PQQ-binding-like beta-propeller repeat protein [Candidatus Bathyarchaeum tardum]
MKKKERTKIIILSLFTVLTLSTILSAFPSVSAASNVKSYPYIGAVPNPVGVNQPVLLHVGITAYLTSTEMGWEGLTITIERPDGETETLGPYRTDSTGGTGAVYTPTMVGTYTLQTHFPEQTVTLPPRGDFTYLAGTSEELELEVQDEPIAYYPGHSLPNEYWTRPIDAQLREWSEISGNWLFVPRNKYTPYNDGPRTAHILWTEPLTSGGIVGGDLGTADLEALGYHGFECGDAYEGKWGGRVRAWGSAGPIIIGGKLYYTDGPHNMPKMYYCVDIRTGEQIWAKTFLDNRSIAFGQLFYWDSFNFHGTFAYLWVTVGSDWYAFDAFTGDWMFTVENVPSGTTRWDSNGGIYRISVDQTNGLLTMWNLTASCINQGASGYGAGSWGNSVHLKTFDAAADTELAQSAWILNVTIPTGLPGRPGEYYFGDRIIGVNANTAGVSSWGLDLSSGTEGNLLFENTWDAPAEWAAGNVSIAVVSYSPSGKDGVFVVFARELREYYGFSQNTGENLWGPTDPEHYLNTFVGTESTIAYGKLISSGVSGVTSCYDVMTGALLWEYAAEDPYQEILWANSWWTKPMFVSDGLIYLAHMEHSSIDPKPRGAPFICLDMETGNEVWRADGLFRQTYWGSNAIIGDSVIATMDTYDQQIYAIGKGPSAITVDVRNDVTLGHAATIFGTVMDVSPGTKDEAIQMRFPNGVPAIADEDMSAWMKYVYKQFERPTDINGVPVKIEIVDPNNQYAWIGTATTDVYGNYAYSFRPQIEGQYMIIATFESSEAYYGSTTTTYLTVDEAPTPATPIDTEEPIDTQTPVDAQEPTAFITSEVAIIAAVAVAAVIGVAALFVLRRRK